MTETSLPESWMTCALSFLIDGIEAGLNFQCIEEPPTGQAAGLVKISSVSWGRFLEQESKTIPPRMEPPEKIRIKVGDLLISRANTIELVGACVIVDAVTKRLYLSDKVLRLCASNEVKRWLLYYLRSPSGRRQIEARSSGNQLSMRNISQEALRSVEVPLPPLNEQKRIADKLDAVLVRVDACRERLDRVPAILKRFRQSVLAAATSGKLTEGWRGPSHDATTWESGTLSSLLEGKPRNGYSPRAVEHETPVRALTLTATTSGRFVPKHFKYIDEDILESSHLWLQPGDILIQRANTIEYVGISAVYDGPPSGFIYPDLMMKCRANQRVLTHFLHYLLLSEPVRRHFRENATGTAGNMPKINQQTVASAPVSWPSREEQTEIVRRVESLFAYADRLETRYTAARAQAERLTPALLAKAFRGELVPQDPNDEPAAVLLERIRAAREAAPAKSRQRKSGSQPTAACT